MIYSLNEIDAQCKKAARGAGFEWGHAEEIGKVARWLAAYELPGARLLSHFLTDTNTQSKDYCPIHIGSYLVDSALIENKTDYQFERIKYPLLLLPFLARLAEHTKLSLVYSYEQNQFNFADGKLLFNTASDLDCKQTELAYCLFNTEPVNGKNAQVTGQDINDIHWSLLNSHAHKTYVPATEESRRGAGPSE